jgi:glucose/mannose-6-phosphate isomerase
MHIQIKDQDIARLDQRRLYKIYTEWPRYLRDASRLLNQVPFSRSPTCYESVVLCGMGGSATSCDIIQEIMNACGSIPAFVIRDLKMPSYVNSGSLVIVNSVSGNTLESLTMMRDALNQNAEVISISAGGKLKGESARSNCHHIDIPDLSLPRASLPYLLIPALRTIEPFLATSLTEKIDSLPDKIEAILKEIQIEVPQNLNIAKQIAEFLADGFPFCYSSPYLLSAATRFKNSLNENAKMHCIRESILEASHNEIVPFTYDDSIKKSRILHLRWSQDPTLINERFDKVHSLFEKVVQSAMEICIPETDLLSALVCAIYILDLSTIYLAIAKNTDPSPTPAIQILKDI